MWKVPAEAANLPERSHGELIAGLARTPTGTGADATFERGELAVEAPIGWLEEAIAIVGLCFFFTSPALGPLLPMVALVGWLMLEWVYIPLGWGEKQPYNPWRPVNYLTDHTQRDPMADQTNLKTRLCKVTAV